MSIVCAVSLGSNYFLRQRKRQHEDDTLKFRIIRVWRGCRSKEIQWLNDVFGIHRNEKMIEKIRKQTEDYHLELKTTSDSLILNNLHINETNRKEKINFKKKKKVSSLGVLYTIIYTIFSNQYYSNCGNLFVPYKYNLLIISIE